MPKARKNSEHIRAILLKLMMEKQALEQGWKGSGARDRASFINYDQWFYEDVSTFINIEAARLRMKI